MKILFTTDSIQRGGKERQMFLLSRALINDGHHVDILSLKFQTPNFVAEYGFPEKQLLISKESGKLSIYRFIREIYRENEYDIVFAWDLQTALVGLLSHGRFKFIFINGCIQHGVRLFKASFLFRSLVCMLSPYVVANSLAGLKANNLKPGPRRFVLYNGIENKFRQSLDGESIRRSRCELIPGYRERPGKVFISVANLVPFKDYETVFKAMKMLKESVPFYYLIMGDGPYRKQVESQIEESGLRENVMVLGHRQNVSDFLAISDCFIHSSRGEGVSNAIVEAMVAGLPVIATRVGGIPETVFPGSSILFEYKNARQLREILENIDQQFPDFDKNSEAYQEHLKKFSLAEMVDNFHGIVRQVIKASHHPC
ncbi:MAG: glycosyltransferase [Thermodesulfovibrionales bacterium]|nr:glycosyltransferase [Thermodesulfovibrionales bacterium]